MDIFKRIKYFIFSLKEKNLQKKLKNTTKKSYINKTSKTVYGKAADLTINTKTKKLIEEVKNSVAAIVKKTNCSPDELINYIKAAKTPVYKITNADKLLKVIKEEEGLICEKIGFEALYLSVITGQFPRFHTLPMFVMREGNIDRYYMLHHFYRWFSLKSGLPGFESCSQKKFKIFMLGQDQTLFDRLSMEDILSLKEAIARDQEATEFVLEYTKHIQGSQNVMNKIRNSGSANI